MLRWLWHNWDNCDKAWKHLLKISDAIDRELFFNSTIMSVGNGRNTPFWKARWPGGEAPKNLALNLFKVARFKKRYVYSELKNNSWIRNLLAIDSTKLLEEFTLLFMALSEVALSEVQDQITWKWTENGC
jgi:hypothetical protein